MEIIIVLLVFAYLFGWYKYVMDDFQKTSGKQACLCVLVIPLLLGGGYLLFTEFWYYGAILLMATLTMLCKGVIRTVLNTLYFLGMAALLPLGFIQGANTSYTAGNLMERTEYGWFGFHVYSIKNEIAWNNGVGTVTGQSAHFDWINALIVLATAVVFFVLPLILWVSNGVDSRRARKHRRAKKIYQKIASAGITDLTDPTRQHDVALLQKHFGIKKVSVLRKEYELGMRLMQNAEQEAEEPVGQEPQKERKQRKKVLKEQTSYEEEKARTAIRGREKYLRPLRTAYNAAVKYHEQLMDMSGEDFFKQKKSDAAAFWWGGLADGMAGVGAGVVVAARKLAEISAHNAAAEDHNRAMAEQFLTPAGINQKIKAEREAAREVTDFLSTMWDDIENKVLDDENVDEKMRFLQFEITGQAVSRDNMELQVSIRLTEEPRLLGKSAVLDGSVRIDVLGDKGEKIGEAYCNAPGFDTWELDQVGFGDLTCKTVAIPMNGKAFEDGMQYTYQVSPVSLWLIER